MKKILVFSMVSCFAGSAFAFESTESLLETVNKNGLYTVLSQPEKLTDRDLDILDLTIGLMDEAYRPKLNSIRELRGLPPAGVSEFDIQPGLTKELAEAATAFQQRQKSLSKETPYLVIFENRTDDNFTEIAVFYRLKGDVLSRRLTTPLPARQSFIFNLGGCGQVVDYVIGAFVGKDMVAKIPQNGNLTPELVSRLHPNDQDPCRDDWHIGEDAPTHGTM